MQIVNIDMLILKIKHFVFDYFKYVFKNIRSVCKIFYNKICWI